MLKPTRILRAEWSSTLHLPKSTLPPRPLSSSRATYLKQCTDDLYSWQAANRPAVAPFVFHDGPPYANGSLHVGHALNKILKDIICRFQLGRGKRIHYVPGWDCHGLPIELKALQAYAEKKKGVSETAHRWMKPVEIREAARRLAKDTIEEQKRGFRAWGVMGDWENAYQTMEKNYELRQLTVFKKMVENGLIYREFKPVYWSPSSGTALAEAELEYDENHMSLAAYIKFKIVKLSPALERYNQGRALENLSALIWTTTPWTLPANKAIAINKALDYTIVKLSPSENPVVIAKSRIDAVLKDAKISDLPVVVVQRITGADLVGSSFINPLQGETAKPQPFIHAEYVGSSSGSGLVHTAPGHGFEDYIACQRYGIAPFAPIDDHGLFTNAAIPDAPEVLFGKSIFKDGNQAVLDYLAKRSSRTSKGDSAVWKTHKYLHKYPIDWRTKQPVVIRATAQWFADVDAIKPAAIRALQDVNFIPESGKSRLESFVNGRSQWCISRQRAWGVPIPALFRISEGDVEAVMTSESVAHILKIIEERGIDAWWTDAEDDPAWIPPNLEGSYLRGKDTMDVWFDSGTSWTLLDRRQTASAPADVFLEGTDQHRGWFQSSLLTHVAHQLPQSTPDDMRIHAPYKQLLTHGFTLDEHGRKMSKSLGNVIVPDEIMNGTLLPPLKRSKKQKHASNSPSYDSMGPDALRLWVASSDYTRDVIIGQPVLQGINNSLHKYRVTMKWLLGVLHDYCRDKIEQPNFVDTIALHQLIQTSTEVYSAYLDHQPFKAVNRINRYINIDLSSFYFETAKDPLYAGLRSERLAAQATCFEIFNELVVMLAPVVPLLVEEVLDHASPSLRRSIQERYGVDHPVHRVWKPSTLSLDPQLDEKVKWLAAVHNAVKIGQERARENKKMGSSLESEVRLLFLESSSDTNAERVYAFFDKLNRNADLANALVVSQVYVQRVESDVQASELNGVGPQWSFGANTEIAGVNVAIEITPPSNAKCSRCWRFAVPVHGGKSGLNSATDSDASRICDRCEEAVREDRAGSQDEECSGAVMKAS